LSCKKHHQMTQANWRKMAAASQPVIVSFLTSGEEGNKSAAYKSWANNNLLNPDQWNHRRHNNNEDNVTYIPDSKHIHSWSTLLPAAL
jgi:hypothetical protein